jgi:hypothetical protein
MSNEGNPRVREIIREMCAGNSSLAAAVLAEEFVIIPKADLPKLELCGCSDDGLFMNEECWDLGNASDSLEHAKMQALEYVAHWQFIASGQWEKVRADEKRNRRRDELASEFTAVNSYNGQLPYTQALINRIIDLESAA